MGLKSDVSNEPRKNKFPKSLTSVPKRRYWEPEKFYHYDRMLLPSGTQDITFNVWNLEFVIKVDGK